MSQSQGLVPPYQVTHPAAIMQKTKEKQNKVTVVALQKTKTTINYGSPMCHQCCTAYGASMPLPMLSLTVTVPLPPPHVSMLLQNHLLLL